MAAGLTDRRATVGTALGYASADGVRVFQGTVNGTLTTEPRGEAGFGAPPGGDGPARGPAAGRVPRRGHDDAYRDGARHRRTRAAPGRLPRAGSPAARAAFC